MDREEYTQICQSMLLRTLASIIAGTLSSILAAQQNIDIGILPTFSLVTVFFFCTGIKFFPASGAWMNLRFRNFRRLKSGLPSLSNRDAPAERFLDDFRRG
ncbi:MAG: hypothetical protein GY899_08620 [Verrucomicrobiaceae bacterium]|nr:hypothetical protein [Verrucomicrobiaceae bacterium]